QRTVDFAAGGDYLDPTGPLPPRFNLEQRSAMDGVSLSVIGLTIQCAGIILITCLSFFMSRSVRRVFLDYWTAAWVCMSVALVSLSVGFRAASLPTLYFTTYFLGEYAFGFLFIAGCSNYVTGGRPAR